VDATPIPRLGAGGDGRRRRITLTEVARHAGVSRATASLVLRNAGHLTPATRERVRESMLALGYVYHRGAASLRASRTHTIGLIVPDISNAFTAEWAIAVESVLMRDGLVTLVANSLEDPGHQEVLVRSMLERQVDGLLAIPAVGTEPAFAELLASSGVPSVLATRDIPHPAIPYVGIDNVNGGRLAGTHLLAHGIEQVSYLGGFARIGPRRHRIQGVRKALRGSGASLSVDVPGPPRGSWGLEIGMKLIESGELTDGIVCHNDLVAFGVYRALRIHGGALSRSVRVISYDDVAAASLWEPPLTTIAADGQEVGARSAEVLLRRIADPTGPAERLLVTSELIVRESCGCPPALNQDEEEGE
jgi:LacI family transcriptional regulator